jgi:hypothetical protein
MFVTVLCLEGVSYIYGKCAAYKLEIDAREALVICMVTASLLIAKSPMRKAIFLFPQLFLFLNVTESTWFLDFYIKISFTHWHSRARGSQV